MGPLWLRVGIIAFSLVAAAAACLWMDRRDRPTRITPVDKAVRPVGEVTTEVAKRPEPRHQADMTAEFPTVGRRSRDEFHPHPFLAGMPTTLRAVGRAASSTSVPAPKALPAPPACTPGDGGDRS